jgi:hypothetical protein
MCSGDSGSLVYAGLPKPSIHIHPENGNCKVNWGIPAICNISYKS